MGKQSEHAGRAERQGEARIERRGTTRARRSAADVEGLAFVVARCAPDADYSALVELRDRPGTSIGRGRTYAGDDLVDEVLDTGTVRLQEHGDDEIPSSNRAMRVPSNQAASRVRLDTARAEAMPKDSL